MSETNNTYEILKSVLSGDALTLASVSNTYEAFKAVYSENDTALRVNIEGGGGSGGIEFYREAITFEVVTEATFASYTGIPDGCTSEISIIAVNAGSDGNDITINGNGADTLGTLIGVWNSSNPSNPATNNGGDFSQVMENKSQIRLSGGASIGDLPAAYTIHHNLDGMLFRASYFFSNNGTPTMRYMYTQSNSQEVQTPDGYFRMNFSDANDALFFVSGNSFLPTTYYVLIEKLY